MTDYGCWLFSQSCYFTYLYCSSSSSTLWHFVTDQIPWHEGGKLPPKPPTIWQLKPATLKHFHNIPISNIIKTTADVQNVQKLREENNCEQILCIDADQTLDEAQKLHSNIWRTLLSKATDKWGRIWSKPIQAVKRGEVLREFPSFHQVMRNKCEKELRATRVGVKGLNPSFR